jgi:outer membrane protein OmpA-like peptidoglycan-associated protein
VPTGESEQRAGQAAGTVAGLGGVEIEHVARNKAEARACADLQGKIDAAVSARGLTFSQRSADLTRPSVSAVRSVARLLARCPSAVVVAEGHTDSMTVKGSTLSLRRAEAVRARLVAGGVAAGRVQVHGFGDAMPVADNDTAAGRARNNRATITVED